MNKLSTLLIACLLCLVATGCSIAKRVTPVSAGTKIGKIYVQTNPNVLMNGLHPEMVQQLKVLGFEVESFDKERPKEAKYWISYTANWQWDMAMYLTYFKATLLEDGKILGSVEYDARMGGGRPDKFGKTAEKIRPLLMELLQNVERDTATAPAMGSGK